MSRLPTPDILGDVLAATVGEDVHSASSIAIASIRTDGGTQPRERLDDNYINELVESLQDGATLPPVDVMYDGERYWLYDGFHRLAAHKAINRVTILARVHQGDQAAAQWESYAANQSHGLRRSPGDKERAIRAALKHPNGAKMSDSLIAKHLGVSNKTVTRYREMMESAWEIPKLTKRQGADGKVYDTTNIGTNQPARKAPIRNHDAALPALQMPAPGAKPMAAKIPIEDWELEDIVEQVAGEYYGSVTAMHGAEMTHQSKAHAGEYWAKLRRVLDAFDVTPGRIEAAVATVVERLVGNRRALRPGSPEAKALAREIKAATWADRRGPVVEKGRGGERKTTQTASALTVDGDLTAADVQVLQPMPPTEPEMVPLAAVSRLGQVIGTALGAAATSPTVEAGIARARELLVTPTPPADDRRTRLSQYAAQFEATLAALRDWAQLTGRFTLTSEAERGLHRVLEATRSELAALNGQPHQVWGEETTI